MISTEGENMNTITDISYGECPEQKLDIYLPENDNFDVFIFFHGGGLEFGTKNDASFFSEELTKNNIAVVSVDYRMYPGAKYPEFITDCAKAVAWVFNNIEEYGKPKRFFIGGSSAGAYISMLLCFDKKYFDKHEIDNSMISGYIHAAGQPTSHFNVLKEKGIDSKRIIVDETAPLYYIGLEKEYPPMLFVVSDNDIPNRLEQTEMTIGTLKHFGYDMLKVKKKIVHSTHCYYIRNNDTDGCNMYSKIVLDFINNI